MIASTTETNFARQFSSVSLVHKMETNIERQFFEVCPFIFAVQQTFAGALVKCLLSKIALNPLPMANKIPPAPAARCRACLDVRVNVTPMVARV